MLHAKYFVTFDDNDLKGCKKTTDELAAEIVLEPCIDNIIKLKFRNYHIARLEIVKSCILYCHDITIANSN